MTCHMYELMNQVPQNTSNATSDPEKFAFVHQRSEAVNNYLLRLESVEQTASSLLAS